MSAYIYSAADIDAATDAALEAAAWAAFNDAAYGDPDATETLEETGATWHPRARATMREQLADFLGGDDPEHSQALALWREAGQLGPSSVGRDFALTRDGHGTGFWDRFAYGTAAWAAGEALSRVARAYGPVDAYLGDDGMLHMRGE